MATKDWSRFATRINVNASIESLFNAWATRAGMESWFLRLAEYKKQDGTLLASDEAVTKGNTYKWLWHGWPDETVEHGIILDTNGKRPVKIQFWQSR